MGIAELRAVVEARGRERVATLRRDAEVQAARLREVAEAEVVRRRADRLERERATLSRETGAQIANARETSRRRVLEAREAFLEQVFAAARRAMDEVPTGSASSEELAARIERALALLPAGPVTITCPPGVDSAIETALGRTDVRVEIDPELSPGFRAIGAEGRVTIDATASALLERDRPQLAIEVLRRLVDGDAL